ncbi:MAG: porin [Sediminibacterium sp.]|nr:porin [Sediminibacterium sp.]
MKKLILAIIFLGSLSSFAQSDSTNNPFKISGYLETYYCYDLANPPNHIRQNYVYSFNRDNEVNLNLGFIKAAYTTNKVRANLAFMAGTYANANLADEPDVSKNIFEANAGIKLSSKKNLWVDAGIFASHIGFESAIGKDSWNLTRSILADHSPYFESGVKISYTSDNQKWFICGLILNGWQRIQRIDGNNTPAFGHQITFTPNSKISLNSSSFIGSDTPDSTRQLRYFHNFYGQFQLTEKLAMLFGFDIGAQQTAKNSSNYYTWYSPVLIFKYALLEKMSISLRGEYYSDPNAVIINTGSLDGFQTYSYSMNFDYQILNNMVWRIEGRGFTSKDKIFSLNNHPSNQNYFFTTALAISF